MKQSILASRWLLHVAKRKGAHPEKGKGNIEVFITPIVYQKHSSKNFTNRKTITESTQRTFGLSLGIQILPPSRCSKHWNFLSKLFPQGNLLFVASSSSWASISKPLEGLASDEERKCSLRVSSRKKQHNLCTSSLAISSYIMAEMGNG